MLHPVKDCLEFAMVMGAGLGIRLNPHCSGPQSQANGTDRHPEVTHRRQYCRHSGASDPTAKGNCLITKACPMACLLPYWFVRRIQTQMGSSSPDRSIVEVSDKDETRLYGTFLAIPAYCLRPVGRPIIAFDETPAGSPEAVRAWFYPGESHT